MQEKTIFVRTQSAEKVLETLQNTETLLTTSQIAQFSGLSWGTVRIAILELLLKGKVSYLKIGSTLGFKLKDDAEVKE